jgi:hypothetical protein
VPTVKPREGLIRPDLTARSYGQILLDTGSQNVAEQIAYVPLNGCICDSSSFSFHTIEHLVEQRSDVSWSLLGVACC